MAKLLTAPAAIEQLPAGAFFVPALPVLGWDDNDDSDAPVIFYDAIAASEYRSDGLMAGLEAAAVGLVRPLIRHRDLPPGTIVIEEIEVALVGVTRNRSGQPLAVYDLEAALMAFGADADIEPDDERSPDEQRYDAGREWYDFNTVRSLPYLGGGAPIFLDRACASCGLDLAECNESFAVVARHAA